jgi:hypothetical protein
MIIIGYYKMAQLSQAKNPAQALLYYEIVEAIGSSMYTPTDELSMKLESIYKGNKFKVDSKVKKSLLEMISKEKLDSNDKFLDHFVNT